MHLRPFGIMREYPCHEGQYAEPQQRLKVMALNIGSFWAIKEALMCYIKDHEISIVVLTEANLVSSRILEADLPNFRCTNRCCRTHENINGGRGGGVLNFTHHARPCLPGNSMTSQKEHGTEHCSTAIYAQCDSAFPLSFVGVYRLPEYRRLS